MPDVLILPYLEQRRRLTPKERRFREEVDRIIKQARKLDDVAVKKALTVLENSRDFLIARIAEVDIGDYDARNLPQILRALNIGINDFKLQYGVLMNDGVRDAWQLGQDLLDKPIQQAQIAIGAAPMLDIETLEVAVQMSADLVTDVSEDMRKKITQEVRRAVLGGQSPQETITALSRDKRFKRGIFKSIKHRAETVMRTEINRVLNISTFTRGEQWRKQGVPGLKKFWIHTQDSRTRPSHRAVGRTTNPGLGGKAILMNGKFFVGGIPARGPHDPVLPAREVINCRCTLGFSFEEKT